MKDTNLKADILTAVEAELDIWLQAQSKIADGYEYETMYLEFAHKVNKIILQKSMGQLPGSRNKKNSIAVWEK
jgi:hypothetical protein